MPFRKDWKGWDGSKSIGNDYRSAPPGQQAELYDFDDLYDTEVQLAEKVGLSIYQFKTAFKLAFGTGPYQMLQDFRFQKAQKLLFDTSLSILDIALKTGYQSSESFTKAYEKKFGIPPSKYRKEK